MATKRYRCDFREPENRRRRDIRMLASDVSQVEAGRNRRVARQTAMTRALGSREGPCLRGGHTTFKTRVAHGPSGLAILTGPSARTGLFDDTTLAMLGMPWPRTFPGE